MEHGAIVPDQPHTRWCRECDHTHGLLFPCPNYPPQVLAAIAADTGRFRAQLQEIEDGVPPVARDFYDIYTGEIITG